MDRSTAKRKVKTMKSNVNSDQVNVKVSEALPQTPLGASTQTHKLVVHCKREEFDVYIGRGRNSVWGNPFSHLDNTLARFKVKTRDEAISSYRIWLWEQIGSGKIKVEDLALLHGKVLGCWCSPKSCHGEVLVAAAAWAAAKLESDAKISTRFAESSDMSERGDEMDERDEYGCPGPGWVWVRCTCGCEGSGGYCCGGEGGWWEAETEITTRFAEASDMIEKGDPMDESDKDVYGAPRYEDDPWTAFWGSDPVNPPEPNPELNPDWPEEPRPPRVFFSPDDPEANRYARLREEAALRVSYRPELIDGGTVWYLPWLAEDVTNTFTKLWAEEQERLYKLAVDSERMGCSNVVECHADDVKPLPSHMVKLDGTKVKIIDRPRLVLAGEYADAPRSRREGLDSRPDVIRGNWVEGQWLNDDAADQLYGDAVTVDRALARPRMLKRKYAKYAGGFGALLRKVEDERQDEIDAMQLTVHESAEAHRKAMSGVMSSIYGEALDRYEAQDAISRLTKDQLRSDMGFDPGYLRRDESRSKGWGMTKTELNRKWLLDTNFKIEDAVRTARLKHSPVTVARAVAIQRQYPHTLDLNMIVTRIRVKASRLSREQALALPAIRSMTQQRDAVIARWEFVAELERGTYWNPEKDEIDAEKRRLVGTGSFRRAVYALSGERMDAERGMLDRWLATDSSSVLVEVS